MHTNYGIMICKLEAVSHSTYVALILDTIIILRKRTPFIYV